MPRYNLATKQGIINCKSNIAYHTKKGSIIEQKHIKKTRSNLQNRALHKYYELLSEALNNVGYYHIYTNVMTGEIIEMQFTKDLVKEFIWKPLQNEIFRIESTTKLTTEMINMILDTITNWLTDKRIAVKFPNKMDLLIEQMNKSNNY